MKRLKILLTILLITFLTFGISFFASNYFNQEVWAASISWDGGAGTNSWSDALNWSTDTVPTDVDDVLIDADVTVNLASGTTVNSLVLGNSGGTTSPILNFTFNSVGTSSPLVVDAGNVEIYSGGNITHSAGGASIVGSVNIDIQTGNLVIYSGGRIDVSSKGHSAEQGLGKSGTYGGAGYGGEGGKASNGGVGGPSYGSLTDPLDIGSGGESSYYGVGGSGGGLVKISIANNLTLNGNIFANGGNGTTPIPTYIASGGSGGSINLSIGNIWEGTGNLSSNGGSGTAHNTSAGGGGGGRISVYGYSSKTFSGNMTTRGGNGGNYFDTVIGKDGGAGTIYLKANGALGDLILNNLGTNDGTSGGVTPINHTSALDNLEISNYTYIDFQSDITVTNFTVSSNSYAIFDFVLNASEVNISDSADITFDTPPTVNNLTITSNGKVRVNSAMTISNTLDLDGGYLYNESTANITYSSFSFLSGKLIDNGGSLSYLEASSISIPSGGTLYANYPRTYVDGIIVGTLTHTSDTDSLEMNFTGNLTISDTGSIILSGLGYTSGNGPSPGTNGSSRNGAGGGAHGGDGGAGESGYPGGTAYDDPLNPQDAGSGGGYSSGAKGGTGGGLLLLEVGGILDLQGAIRSNGTNGTTYDYLHSGGGGAGGGINITTNAFTGDGVIEAKGGNGINSYNEAHGGGGGGGLISVVYDENSFTGTTDVSGGSGGHSGQVGVVNIAASNQAPTALHSDISTPQDLYAGRTYSISAIYSDPDGEADLSNLYFKIVNPVGDDIELRADNWATDLTDQTPSILTGSSYIENVTYDITPTYGTANEVEVTWNFDIGWNWTETIEMNYGVQAIDSAGVNTAYSLTTDGYSYSNTLEFNQTGTLLVTDESGVPVPTGTWFLPESVVNWTGYKVVYEGETDVYPNPEEYNIKLEDSTGRFWLDSGAEGVDFNLTTETVGETTEENIYTLSIVDLPTGAVSTDSKNFTIKVDADNPAIVSLLSSTHPDEESWYSESEVEVEWEIEDSHSGINETYIYVSNNPEESISAVKNSGTLITTTSFTTDTLEDGIYYIYLLTTDIVGNQKMESIFTNIDTTEPDVVEVRGPYKDVWQNVDSGPPLTWTDPLSISDDIFYITIDGTLPSPTNFKYATNQALYNIHSIGEGEHTVKVRACNGANTCGTARSFLIKYDSIPTSTVRNISTSLSSSNKVTVNWSNPTESDFAKVVVVRKTGSVPSTVKDGTKVYEGSNRSFTDSTLNSSTTYHYGIWAYDHVENVSERNSVSVTTLDLNPPSPVTNFKVVLEDSNSVKITWENPGDKDFSGVVLYRGEDLIYEGEEQEFIDILEAEGEYEYKIKTFDSSDNFSNEEIVSYNFISPSEDVLLVKEDFKSEKVEEGKKSKIKTGESVEIKIPVRKLMGDVVPEDTDTFVLSISDVEYEMVLSEDRSYFSTRFVAPSTKGNHNISIRAIREGAVLAQYDLEVEVVDYSEVDSESGSDQEKGLPQYIYWIGGFVVLLLSVASVTILSKSRNQREVAKNP